VRENGGEEKLEAQRRNSLFLFLFFLNFFLFLFLGSGFFGKSLE